jgi:L-ascorbate metabolism protein UlaG (beta-lactamase superfamily)
MRGSLVWWYSLLLLLCSLPGVTAKVDKMLDNVHWLGHDGFRLTVGKTIYLDPYRLEAGGPVADIILLTHAHGDHCSLEDITKIRGPRTVIVGPADALAKLTGTTRAIKVGEKLTLGKISITAVPAYNIGKAYHPKENGWMGYVITVGGVRIYHAGDTDLIPEMTGLKADIALLPVSGKYTMTAEEAAQAALRIRPRYVIPMHYGTVIGSDADARRLADGLQGKIQVVLKPREQP